MKVLTLTPRFFGWTGDAVNERQLITALATKVNKCYVVTFVGFNQVFTRRRTELRLKVPKNMIILALPIPQATILMQYSLMLSISCILSIIVLVLDTFRKIDLIYVRNSFLSMGFLTFQSLSRRTVVKIPALVEDEIQHERITRFLIQKSAQYLDRLVLAKAKKVAVNSELFYEKLVRRRFFKHKDKPVEIPPGIDLELIRRVKDKAGWKPSGRTIDIGFVGSMSWWQGVDILVRAVALLKGRIQNLRLVIVGDGESRSLVERMCKTLNIDYEITGFLPHENALRRFVTLDVLVLPRKKMPTAESSIPIKVIEAWALGVPVITSSATVLRDRNTKNQDALYCEPEPTNVSRAIVELLEDNELRKRLVLNGHESAASFEYARIAENLLGA